MLKTTPEAMESVLAWIGAGNPLSVWCRHHGMDRSLWVDARKRDPEFAKRWAEARTSGAEAMVDLAQEVADGSELDTVVDDAGRRRPDHEWIARSKLRVDVLMKRAANYDPKNFGTKASVEHSGGLTLESLVLQSMQPKPAAAE